ncbi:hypothetical protein T12_2904 [Trichinella patagoniensis]|uniref:Uncharacterized protein n=1 Tax=Trichinella patagoniensis TaxID=990121 RepID=A0A0V1A8K6_9BILA|nr:hypothetical protein T12_2904 [Trichinella patagoniensis]
MKLIFVVMNDWIVEVDFAKMISQFLSSYSMWIFWFYNFELLQFAICQKMSTNYTIFHSE